VHKLASKQKKASDDSKSNDAGMIIADNKSIYDFKLVFGSYDHLTKE